MKYINADDVKDFIERALDDDWMIDYAVDRLDEMPPADVRENIHGEWFDKGSLSCRCSSCGCKSSKESKFCSECGADMRKWRKSE